MRESCELPTWLSRIYQVQIAGSDSIFGLGWDDVNGASG